MDQQRRTTRLTAPTVARTGTEALPEGPQTKAGDVVEVTCVARDEGKPVLDGCGRDQGIRHRNAGLAADSARAFGDGTVHGHLAERPQQLRSEIRGCRSREELCSGDDRVVDPMPAGPKGSSSS